MRQLLRWAALPVTDRRWAPPLLALALGFGLFIGVAIGPGAAGTLATSAAPIVEIPGLVGDDEGDDGAHPAPSGDAGGGEEEPLPAATSSLPSFESASESFEEPFSAEPESPEPRHAPAAPDEEEPEAETLSGTVVHVNPAAGSYALAEAGGTLNAVHAAKAPAPGTEVSVPVRPLANGTFAEAGQRRRLGRREQATFDGVVSFVGADPADPLYTVSKRGVSVLVHVRPDPAGAVPSLPALGAFATVAVDIEKPLPEAEAPAPPVEAPAAAGAAPPAEAPPPAPQPVPPACAADPALAPPAPVAVLWQRQIKADGLPFAYSDFEGIVTAVCPAEAKLLLSADDLRAAGADLAFTVPEGIDTSALEVGDSVAATATIDPGGALALTGLASDERAKGAEDLAATQGDLAP